MAGPLNRPQIAWRIAQDIPDGAYVNLGIGMPEMVGDYLPDDREVMLHSENGILGLGPSPAEGEEDWDLINAGKKPVTLVPGGAYFHHTDSFAMVRGGHLDLCVLGAYQVSAEGDLANWSTGDESRLPAIGGAMDLAMGARGTYVMMELCTRKGAPEDSEALHLSPDRGALRQPDLYRFCRDRYCRRRPGGARNDRRHRFPRPAGQGRGASPACRGLANAQRARSIAICWLCRVLSPAGEPTDARQVQGRKR